jgi:hypothetical protein
MKPNPEIISRLKDTFYMVEANSNERHHIWRDFAHNSDSRWLPGIQIHWEQIHDGYCVNLGKLGKRPVVMSLTWDRLDGKLICFWELCSQVADYAKSDKFIEKYFRSLSEENKRAVTDAGNFALCLHALKRGK